MWELSSLSEAAMQALRFDRYSAVIPSQPRHGSTAPTGDYLC